MSSLKSRIEANRRIGALHQKTDPQSVVRRGESNLLQKTDPQSVVRRGESNLLLDPRGFTDDELINTHPLEMTSPMLEAARLRINEDEDFAKRYRSVTDYTPRKIRGMNFAGRGL